MTSHVGRLYALALALVVFFLAWAVVSAHPWRAAAPDPRLQQLAVREAQLKREAVLVQQIVDLRRRTVQQSERQLASAPAAPAVRIVNLPPLTVTRTS